MSASLVCGPPPPFYKIRSVILFMSIENASDIQTRQTDNKPISRRLRFYAKSSKFIKKAYGDVVDFYFPPRINSKSIAPKSGKYSI